MALDLATSTLTILDTGTNACNNELTDSTIVVDTTLDMPCYQAPNGLSVNSPATLTVLPGVRVEFGAGTQLQVNQGAALKAVGTQAAPITFTGIQPMPGFWGGVEYFSNHVDNVLDFVTIEYGGTAGSANLSLFSPDSPRVRISNTTLRNSAGYGFDFGNGGSTLETFENVTSTGNAQGAGLIAANDVGQLGSTNDFSGNTQDRIVVISNFGVTSDQTWFDLGTPYALGIDTSAPLNVDAHLTLAPGSTLVFHAGHQLNVRENGTLTAVGTVSEPIRFMGKSHVPGFWKGIQFTFSNTNNELSFVTVEDGGGSGNGNANVVMFGTTLSPQRLRLSDVVLRNSAGYGFEFNDGSILEEFHNVLSTGNELGAGLVPAQLLGELDTASQYTGNTVDEVRVTGSKIDLDTTWPRLEVPYVINNLLNVDAALTIEAGTSMIFRANAGFDVSSEGSLTAIGTAQAPILFTGAQQTPGFWAGISFISSDSADNVLDNVIFEYAGNSGLGSGSIVLYGRFTPDKSNATLRNSVVRNSSTWGVWAHTASTYSSSNNTFSNNASGNESLNN